MIYSGSTAANDLGLLDFLLRSIRLYLKLLPQSGHVVLDHDVPGPLQSFTMVTKMVINLVVSFLVYNLVLESQFASQIFSVFALLVEDSQLLHHFVVKIFVPEERQAEAVFEQVVLLGFVSETCLYDFKNRVVIPKAYWKLILAEILRDENFIALFDLQHEQLFAQLNSFQNGFDQEQALDRTHTEQDIQLAEEI